MNEENQSDNNKIKEKWVETLGALWPAIKGSLAQVAAEGYFDRNWKLPPDVAEKLAASGTVIIQK